jgi:hypothetical protein
VGRALTATKNSPRLHGFSPHIGIAAIDAGGGVANFEVRLTGTLVLSASDFIA